MSDSLDKSIMQAAAVLRLAKSVCMLTGAGVSAESGLRTFRGSTADHLPEHLKKDMSALWKEFDPTTLATPEAFAENPELVSCWYDWRRLGCLAAEPNDGHIAIAKLQDQLAKRGGSLTLLTQNVDGLHQRAGAKDVVELHGSITRWRCTKTQRTVVPEPKPFAKFPPQSEFGGLLRPDVVWFGEQLPQEAIIAASDASQTCDVFMTIGTSAVVFPAAGFIHVAKRRGVPVIEVNPDDTGATKVVDIALRGRSADILPRLVEAMIAL